MSSPPPSLARPTWRPAAWLLMLASGFAGLGYQIVWTQQCALWLGHEGPAVLAVVAAFFGGLAVGAAGLGPRIDRSRAPQRWYAACELLIGAWSLGLAAGLPTLATALLSAMGPQPGPVWQWVVAFGGVFVCLLPATAAMGATLPAMTRVLAAPGRDGRALSALYASNTAGAMLGVLVTAGWLIPAIGLLRTAAACAALNLLCAVLALPMRPHGAAAVTEPAAPDPHVRGLLALTGLLGIGYEVVVVRVLSQVTEDTVYTFALLLAVYLGGTAAGAAAYRRGMAVARPDRLTTPNLLAYQSLACALGGFSLWQAAALREAVAQALGPGMGSALAAEAALALAAFVLPTVVMGAVFSHLMARATRARVPFGRALAANTAAAALAPALVGAVAVPLWGAKAVVLCLVAGYLALSFAARPRLVGLLGPALAVVTLALAMPPLAFVDVPPGGRLLRYEEGPMAAVSVVEDRHGTATLRINNRQQEGSSATLLADGRQALLPLLLHPQPRRALFLGLGTGLTAATAAQDRSLQVDVAELLPEVIRASDAFAGVFAADAPRPHIVAADARRFVRTAPQRYDLIVADNFHPARSGSGALYTVEHFQAIRGRLQPDGLFCQWLPLHQLDLDTLRSIVRSFMAVYPDGHALLATHSLQTPVLGLVARRDGRPWQQASLQRRLVTAAAPLNPAAFGLPDPLSVLGMFVAGPAALAQWSQGAALNTDDRPVVAYRAPRITYAPDSPPAERLSRLMQVLHIRPDELIDVAAQPAWGPRLAAYWQARDRFVAAGLHVRPSADPQAMLAQVRQPLLEALSISPDFRPAYDPLLRLAAALEGSDPARARDLLVALQSVQPARPEAAALLTRLPLARP